MARATQGGQIDSCLASIRRLEKIKEQEESKQAEAIKAASLAERRAKETEAEIVEKKQELVRLRSTVGDQLAGSQAVAQEMAKGLVQTQRWHRRSNAERRRLLLQSVLWQLHGRL